MRSLLRDWTVMGAVILWAMLLSPASVHAEGGAVTPAAAPDKGLSVTNDVLDESATITLDFKEADINTVLRVLSIKSKINIVAGPEVKGTVTIRLESVPWEKALDVVLRTYDYVYERDGNIIRVTTREKMAQEPVITQTFVLNYTRAQEVQTSIQDMLTERGRIRSASRTNALVVTDIPTNLYRMGQVVKQLDRITPQAYIDSKVINTEMQTAENLGIQWSTGGSATSNVLALQGASRPVTFPFYTNPRKSLNGGVLTAVNGNDESIAKALEGFLPLLAAATAVNPVDGRAFPVVGLEDPTNATFSLGTLDFTGFRTVLEMLKSRSNTKIVSNPRVVVLNNQTARIQVGEDVPLPTFERNENTGSIEISGFSFREVGVVLNVTPHINSAEEILVDLHPEVSSQGDSVNFGAFQIPGFNVTRAETQVLIRSGETIAIGGLLTDNVATNETKVPFVGDIPLVGKLFRSKRQTPGTANAKSETLFFVTVTMVDSLGQPAGKLAKNDGTLRIADDDADQKSDSEPAQPAADADKNADSLTADSASQEKVPVETQSQTATTAEVPESAAA